MAPSDNTKCVAKSCPIDIFVMFEFIHEKEQSQGKLGNSQLLLLVQEAKSQQSHHLFLPFFSFSFSSKKALVQFSNLLLTKLKLRITPLTSIILITAVEHESPLCRAACAHLKPL